MSARRTARQMRADDTRHRLFQAAAQLFALHGYHDTTVDQIVQKAGVAKGTFFVHFATKDAVITELVRHQVRAARRARATALGKGSNPLEAILATMMTLGAEGGASRPLSRAVLAAILENPEIGGYADALFGELLSDVHKDVLSAQHARLLDPRADPESIAEALLASYLGAILHFAASPRARPLIDLLRPRMEATLSE